MQLLTPLIAKQRALNSAPWPYLRVPANHAINDDCVPLDLCILQYDGIDYAHALVYFGIGPYTHIGAQDCRRVDVGGGMDEAGAKDLLFFEFIRAF